MTIRTELTWTVGGREATTVCELPDDEQGFWRGVASHLGEMDVPNVYTVETPLGRAELEVGQRGTYIKDGEERPSMFVVPTANCIGLPPGKYDDAYLTCINPESAGGRGNYKFYRLQQRPDGTVTAFYGRIGQQSGFGAPREVRDPMPSWMFEVRKAEKLAKGYVDQTRAYLGGEVHGADGAAAIPADEGSLYGRLLAYARQRLASSLAAPARVCTGQVRESRRILAAMGRLKTAGAFNRRLLELMQVSPRSASSVGSFLARGPEDFPGIMSREESLLAAMEAVVSAKGRKAGPAGADGFAQRGIAVSEASGSAAAEALSQVPGQLRRRVRRVWRVEPAAQSAAFAAYLESRKLGPGDVKLMWHGSRNENWCSIVENSLMLNPNARITGKMFGHGIYFGYDEAGGGALKSWNYTSARGTVWARGTQDTAFMGLYACAYGKPMHPDRPRQFTKGELDGRGCDCLHALGRTCGLKHDEVVFFDEAAVCIRYLVEFDG